jgi:alpha-1,2-mannosyltransferase
MQTPTNKAIHDTPIKIGLTLLLVGIYGLLFYCVLTYRYRLDFSSLYSACQALSKNDNPYQVFLSTYLPTIKQLPVNLNPPILFWLFSPFTYLNYHYAVALWSLLSLLLGIQSVHLVFQYAFSPSFLKKNAFYLYAMYLLFFATIVNTAIAQLGTLLLFFIMNGYHCYMTKRDWSAGIWWGLAISIKFFPGLLFIFVLLQKRLRVGLSMLLTFLLMSFIPLFFYGVKIYTHYLAILPHTLWYGDSWNASLYGMLFRLFGALDKAENILLIKFIYGVIFCISLLWYCKKIRQIEKAQIKHKSFCLTLVMMLLLSPLGWLYYFPLLIFPLALTWRTNQQPIKRVIIWFSCLFLLNFPMDYIHTHQMSSWLAKSTIYSFHFYGVILLLYLTCHINYKPLESDKIRHFLLVFCSIFSFELLILSLSFLSHLL